MSTAELLANMPDDGNRYELVGGVLRMMSPAGGRHGRIAVGISILLGIHVKENDLGATFAAETGFKIATDPDTVGAPDAAFVTRAKIDSLEDDSGYLPFAPDLAVEVVSPSDSFASVEEKAFDWIDARTQLVLVVVPESRSVHAYRSRKNISVHAEGEIVDADDAVAGWKLEVSKIFH